MILGKDRTLPTPGILVVIGLGAFITALDQTVVVTALPSIMLDLKVPIAELDRVTLRSDWRLVLEEHSDRFLFGTDIGPGDRDSQVGEVVPWYQDMLGQLDRVHAEAIANGNARRLFALE